MKSFGSADVRPSRERNACRVGVTIATLVLTILATAVTVGTVAPILGTMIEDVGYLDTLDRIAFFPWTVDAIRALNRAGLPDEYPDMVPDVTARDLPQQTETTRFVQQFVAAAEIVDREALGADRGAN